MPRPAPRPARPLLLATCATLLLALGGCQSDEGASGEAARGPTATAGRSTDPGSRYLDPSGPIGGLSAETPPATGLPAGAAGRADAVTRP